MSVWTDEKVAELRRLHAQGLTDQEISKRIKIARNGVLGKRHRLGLKGNAQLKPTRAKQPHKLQCHNPPHPNDPDRAIDMRDIAILDAVLEGRSPAAIAKAFRTTEDRVRELWRVRELQEPVGEVAA